MPGPGQVRIAVAAAGVHLIDTVLRRGDPGRGPGRPCRASPAARWPAPSTPWAPTSTRLDRPPGRRPPRHVRRRLRRAGGPPVAEVLPYPRVPGRRPDDAAAVAMIGTGRTTLAILEFTGGLGPGDVSWSRRPPAGSAACWSRPPAGPAPPPSPWPAAPGQGRGLRHLGADLSVDYRAAGWADEVPRGLERARARGADRGIRRRGGRGRPGGPGAAGPGRAPRRVRLVVGRADGPHPARPGRAGRDRQSGDRPPAAGPARRVPRPVRGGAGRRGRRRPGPARPPAVRPEGRRRGPPGAGGPGDDRQGGPRSDGGRGGGSAGSSCGGGRLGGHGEAASPRAPRCSSRHRCRPIWTASAATSTRCSRRRWGSTPR